MKTLTHPKYRPDIDGLRAIAVLLVVMFHAFPNLLRGGFIGVDIFFVISGYLISTIIFENLASDSFSFREFYVRRIRRIYPALLAVAIAVLAFGWGTLFLDEYKQLGKHVAAGAAFVSNLVLWSESGYFDNSGETKPLLHLWSLGIEEQFYIVWPLLAWLTWKSKFNLLTITFITALASFILNIGQISVDVTATFYSPLTRFWELLAGSLLAKIALNRATSHGQLTTVIDSILAKVIYEKIPRQSGSTLDNTKSLVGMLLIICGLVVINKGRSFPGWWALLPVFGALLIISGGMQSWLNRTLLSNRLLVWFGLISYPLYLWHWPILSFLRIAKDGTPSNWELAGAVIVAIILSALTYWYIEQPIRQAKLKGKYVTPILFCNMVFVGIFGYSVYYLDGVKQRNTETLQVMNNGEIGHDLYHAKKGEKNNLCAQYIHLPSPCFQDKSNNLKKKLAVIGDSHADDLSIGLAHQLPEINVVFYDALGLPLLSTKEGAGHLESIASDKQISTVILAAAWAGRLATIVPPRNLESELIEVVNKLNRAGKKVYLSDDVPNFSFIPTKCKFNGGWMRENKCSDNMGYFFNQRQTYYPIFESVAKTASVNILNISKYFCDAAVCSMKRDEKLMYRDNNHLNFEGSSYVAKRIVEANPHLID